MRGTLPERMSRTPLGAEGSASVVTWAALAAVSVAGALLILLRHANYGVGLDRDAALYVAAARNLVAGNGLLAWDGTPYQGAGPLYPLLLAAAGFLGFDVIDAAGSVNAAAFGLTVFAAAAWVKRHVRSPWLAVWAGCACALAPTLAFVAAFAAPEAVFVLFVVVSLSLLDRFLGAGSRSTLLLAAAAAAAACLTRYAGVSLAAAGALVLLLRRAPAVRRRIGDAAVWAALSLVPGGVWMVRNLPVIESPLGAATGDPFSGLISLHRAAGELVSWLLGSTGLDLLTGPVRSAAGVDLTAAAPAAIVVQAAVLAAAAVGAAALVRRRPGFVRRRRTVLAAALVFAAAYTLVLAVSLPLAGGALPVRSLLPLFPPLLVVAALVLDEFTAHRAAAAGAVAVLMAAWLALPAAATYDDVRRWRTAGPEAGYSSKRWTESAVIRYLNRNRMDDAVWSTDPVALYFHTGRRPLAALNPSLDALTERLAGLSPATSVWVVWFDDSIHAPDYDAGEVAALPGMELMSDQEDGVIFRVTGAADVVLRSPVFDIFLYEDALAYFKEPCSEADVQADLFLHVIPADAADLSAAARAQDTFFNSLDFSFSERGIIRDGRCLAVVTFDYRIVQFHTGQFRPGQRPFWEVESTERLLRLLPYRRAYRSILEGAYGAPAARSNFDVYLTGSRLTYVREPCAAEDAAAPFFLHVVPADPSGLPANLDFAFAERGALLGGACVAIAELPNDRIARVRTGQYAPGGGRIWDLGFTP